MKIKAEDIILHENKIETISHIISAEKNYKCPYCKEKHKIKIRKEIWHSEDYDNNDNYDQNFQYELIKKLEQCEEKEKIRKIQKMTPNKDSIILSQEVCGNCLFSVSEESSHAQDYEHIIGDKRYDYGYGYDENPTDLACKVHEFLIPEYGKCDEYEHDPNKDSFLEMKINE